MHDKPLPGDRSAENAASGNGGAEANRGIGFPRLYDLLLFFMTRGRDPAYRAELLDFAGIAPGHDVLDVGFLRGTRT
jgi:hypothetical protein